MIVCFSEHIRVRRKSLDKQACIPLDLPEEYQPLVFNFLGFSALGLSVFFFQGEVAVTQASPEAISKISQSD